MFASGRRILWWVLALPNFLLPQLLAKQRLAIQNPKSAKNFLAFGPPQLL
jgi:hypothetical protein